MEVVSIEGFLFIESVKIVIVLFLWKIIKIFYLHFPLGII